METHTGKEIADKIMVVLREFDLVDRTISVTFDNHAANKTAVTELLTQFTPVAGEYLIHQRCAAHIINLMVQAGLEKLGPVITEISGCVRYCFGQSLRLGRWLRYCESRGVQGRIIGADSEHRWNTTYIMLDRLLPYAELFQGWFNNDFGENRLTERHWVVARMVRDFFEVFFETTTCLSSSSQPTSTLAMHKLHEIGQVFEAHFNHPELNDTIQAMLVVFRKYFFPMPPLYSFAFILDPRIKTRGLKEFLRFLQTGTGIPYEAGFEEAHVLVYHVYSMYENKYKHSVPSADTFTHSPVKRSWSKFNDRMKAIAGKGKASASGTASNTGDCELTSYLNTKFRNLSQDNLDVLNWWRIHESEYPILSILARDILTIPVTSVSSEEAFSTAENMLDPSRNRLTPRLVKAMTCLKDWELAAMNEQPSPSAAHDTLVSDMSVWTLDNI